jgi:hypothetical protein
VVTVDDVRAVAAELPRSYEVVVRGRIKFRVKQIVYLAFSRDETVMGFGYPREERAALVASAPHVFHLPGTSDMRFQWAQTWLAELDEDVMGELVVDAWRMVVPKRVALERLGAVQPEE